MKKTIALLLALMMTISLFTFTGEAKAADEITVTDMIGREVTVTPGSYQPALFVCTAT